MVNLRNKPVDRRRLDGPSRWSYRHQERAKAVKLAQARRGYMAQSENSDKFRTERKPGTGGFTGGLNIQQQRMRDVGDENRRAESFRPQ